MRSICIGLAAALIALSQVFQPAAHAGPSLKPADLVVVGEVLTDEQEVRGLAGLDLVLDDVRVAAGSGHVAIPAV